MESCGQLRTYIIQPLQRLWKSLNFLQEAGSSQQHGSLPGFESWSSSQQPIHINERAIPAYKSVTDFVPMQDEGKAPHMFASGLDGSKQPSLRLGTIEWGTLN
jgi:hypothetical protein